MSKVLGSEAGTQDECVEGADTARELGKKFKMWMLLCSYYKMKHLDIAMQVMQSHCRLK